MTIQASALAESYVRTINSHNAAEFLALFADGAEVNDAGREIGGREAIREWSEREIFGVQVKLDVLDEAERDGEAVITTEVDGNFDRTGLPDPVVITQRIETDGAKITKLTCQLATEQPAAS